MIVIGRHLPRRTFLKGLGAAVALPVLDAMTPAFAGAGREGFADAPGFTYVPNGVTMPDWTPAETGRGFELPRILEPLAPYRDDMLVLTGPRAQERECARRRPRRSRARGCRVPDRRPRPQDGRRRHPERRVGRSDRRRAHRQRHTLSSIELGCDDSRTVGNCDSGYSCAYTNSLSWRSPTSPMPPETNPRLAVRAAVRRVRRRARRRHTCPADAATAAASSTPCRSAPARSSAISARPIGARWTSTSPRSARSSAASSSPSTTCAACRRASRCRAACRCSSPTT